jgi:D-3-phosphoglycerate dehydrogenase
MNILIASSIHREAIETLESKHDVVCAFDGTAGTLKEAIKDREVLILRSGVQITSAVMACAPNLKLVLRAGSGVDNIDLDYIASNDIRLVRIPGPGARAVAEMAFALMLTLSRNILEADHLTRQGHWAKHKLTGYLLRGKTLGIVGAGNIGLQVADMGRAWGMDVIGCVERPNAERTARFEKNGLRLVDLETVLRESDFVSAHVSLQPSTRDLFDADAFSRMKPGAYLVNLTRGGVVNESALLSALTEGKLRGAALDVHEAEGEGKISPLAGLKNVVLTPHIGAGTFDSQREIGEIVINTIDSFSAGIEVETHE